MYMYVRVRVRTNARNAPGTERSNVAKSLYNLLVRVRDDVRTRTYIPTGM